jgi:phosphate regulon transcriptional regulator PhoB
MPAKQVMILEDEADISRLIRMHLEKEGLRVTECEDGQRALALIQQAPPDLLILDLMLPGLPGLEVCRQIRGEKRLAQVPILILTARGDETDRVLGLEMGADDYVTKPFSPPELVARVKALLRRLAPPEEAEETLEAGALQIDPSSLRVRRGEQTIQLSALEFRLLYYLARHPNRVFSRMQLLETVWGRERVVVPRSVDVYMRHLRRKIEYEPDEPVFLKTVRGAGYMFELR